MHLSHRYIHSISFYVVVSMLCCSIIYHHQHRLVMSLLLAFMCAMLRKVKVQLCDVDGFPCITLIARDFARGITTEALSDWRKLIIALR